METHAVLCSQGLTAAPALLTHPDDVIVAEGNFRNSKSVRSSPIGLPMPVLSKAARNHVNSTTVHLSVSMTS